VSSVFRWRPFNVTAETSNSVSVRYEGKQGGGELLVDSGRGGRILTDGKRAYVTAEIGGTLSVIDTEVPYRGSCHHSRASRQGKTLGVVCLSRWKWNLRANGSANVVSVIDARERGGQPDPGGQAAWGSPSRAMGEWCTRPTACRTR